MSVKSEQKISSIIMKLIWHFDWLKELITKHILIIYIYLYNYEIYYKLGSTLLEMVFQNRCIIINARDTRSLS